MSSSSSYYESVNFYSFADLYKSSISYPSYSSPNQLLLPFWFPISTISQLFLLFVFGKARSFSVRRPFWKNRISLRLLGCCQGFWHVFFGFGQLCLGEGYVFLAQYQQNLNRLHYKNHLNHYKIQKVFTAPQSTTLITHLTTPY